MDILKILSRGTSRTHSGGDSPAGSTLKRKRNDLSNSRSNVQQQQQQQQQPSNGNDKAEIQNRKSKKRKSSKSKEDAIMISEAEANITSTPDTPRLLDEQQIREELRLRHLKFSLLSCAHDGSQQAKTQGEVQRKKAKKKHAIFPMPLLSFSELHSRFHVSKRLLDNIRTAAGFDDPTTVQAGSLPLLLNSTMALACDSSSTAADSGIKTDSGVHLMVEAPTGSGKTLAFIVPLINGILKCRAIEKQKERSSERSQDHVLEAVIVVPTQELADQIVRIGVKLAHGTGVKIVGFKRKMVIPTDEGKTDDFEEEDDSEERDKDEEAQDDDDEGEDGDDDDSDSANSGVDSNESDDSDEGSWRGFSDGDSESNPTHSNGKPKPRFESKPKSKPRTKLQTLTQPDILITTPLFLAKFLTRNGKNKTLPQVQQLVLDEADALLDPDLFQKSTLTIWSACTHPSLRFSFWSATISSSTEELVKSQLQKKPISSTCSLIRLVVDLKDTAVAGVTHRLVPAGNEEHKLYVLCQLLGLSQPIEIEVDSSSNVPRREPLLLRQPLLVFVHTAPRARELYDELTARGVARIALLNASLPHAMRADILARFRGGEVRTLITTDLLMRGIDFQRVNGVLNYDIPASRDYIHRVGRMDRGRRAGGGLAVTLWTEGDVVDRRTGSGPGLRSIANVIIRSEEQSGMKGTSGLPGFLRARLLRREGESENGKEVKKKKKGAIEAQV